MSKDSKKRVDLKKQIQNKLQTADISFVEHVAKAVLEPKKYQLVDIASTIPENTNEESQRFIICFDYLNWDACVFKQFDQTLGKKLVVILQKVATCEVQEYQKLKLSRDSVTRTDKIYTSLFTKLSPDVDRLDETELGSGRIFFYITEPYFNVVSIETKHRDIYG